MSPIEFIEMKIENLRRDRCPECNGKLIRDRLLEMWRCERHVRDRSPIGGGSSRTMMTGVHECGFTITEAEKQIKMRS